MPEAQTETKESSQSSEAGEGKQAAALGPDEIKNLAVEAARAAVAQSSSQVSPDEFKQLKTAYETQLENDKAFRKRLSSAISGEKEGGSVSPTLRSLVQDTDGTIAQIIEAAETRAEKRVMERLQSQQDEYNTGYQVLADRPDIMGDKEAVQELAELYARDSSERSPKEKWEAAIKTWDKIMERAGKGSVKDRIAAASSPASSGSPTQGNRQSDERSYTERAEATIADEIAERQKRHAEKFNLHQHLLED